jgi:hypothetical protein
MKTVCKGCQQKFASNFDFNEHVARGQCPAVMVRKTVRDQQQTVIDIAKAKLVDKPSVTVRDYLRLTQAAVMTARENRGTPIQLSVARHAAALLRDARIFHMNPASYFAAYRAADVYTTTSLAGLDYREDPRLGEQMRRVVAGTAKDLSALTGEDETHNIGAVLARTAKRETVAGGRVITDFERQKLNEGQLLLAAMQEGQLDEPFPGPLPFPTTYIGFGGTVGLSPMQVAIALESSTVDGHAGQGAQHLGFTLGHTDEHGDVVLEHMMTEHDGPITITRYFDGAWVGLMSLAPWVVNSLVALINENRTIVEEHPVTPAMRYDHKRIKIERLIPRPYYTLRLKPQVIDESMRRSATLGRYMFHYTYRFDVRGHERLRIQRGDAPIDDKARSKLAKRGYTIYESASLMEDELLKKLDVRGFARPRAGEWFAVLTTWVDSHQKGPTEAPYIPAVRTVGDRRVA